MRLAASEARTRGRACQVTGYYCAHISSTCNMPCSNQRSPNQARRHEMRASGHACPGRASRAACSHRRSIAAAPAVPTVPAACACGARAAASAVLGFGACPLTPTELCGHGEHPTLKQLPAAIAGPAGPAGRAGTAAWLPISPLPRHAELEASLSGERPLLMQTNGAAPAHA